MCICEKLGLIFEQEALATQYDEASVVVSVANSQLKTFHAKEGLCFLGDRLNACWGTPDVLHPGYHKKYTYNAYDREDAIEKIRELTEEFAGLVSKRDIKIPQPKLVVEA